MMVDKHILKHVRDSARAAREIADNPWAIEVISEIGAGLSQALAEGNKILICGNGGSAADAQHFAAELTGRFVKASRPALPAIALTTDTSALTAIGNDFGFEHIFERQVEALGVENDVLVAISTSGNSLNILAALAKARDMSMRTIGFTSYRDNNPMYALCDVTFDPKCTSSALIQQSHIMAIHAICSMIDNEA